MTDTGVFEIPQLRIHGRCHLPLAREAGALPLFWAGSGAEVCFTGTELRLVLEADFQRLEPWIAVELNGAPLVRMPLERGVQELCLFRGMAQGPVKRVRLYKETQPMTDDPRHSLRLRGFRWEGGGFVPVPPRKYRLEFVGDSLTSGEGVAGAVEETEWITPFFRGGSTWARYTADALDGDWRAVSQSGWGIRSGWDNDPRHAMPDWYERICGPALGEADQALGSQEREDFSLWKPDAVVINLGTNDAGALEQPPWQGPDGAVFRQMPTPEGLADIETAAVDFLCTLRRCHPGAKLVWAYGMCGGRLRPQLEGAVARFRRETGDRDAYYVPLPAAEAETMGSLKHPGPACHQQAAGAVVELLRNIL